MWTQKLTAAQRLQFEQIALEAQDNTFNTAEEYVAFIAMGRTLDTSKMKRKQGDGKYIRVNMKTSQHRYMAARGGTSPYLPGSNPSSNYRDKIPTPDVEELQFDQKDVYIQIDYSGPAKAAVKSKEGGYENLVDWRVKDAQEGLKVTMAQKLSGSALAILGVIEDASQTAGGGTNYEKIRVRYAGYNAANLGLFAGVVRLEKGMVVDASNGVTGALRTGNYARGRCISDVAEDTGAASPNGVIVTFDEGHNGTWSNGDCLVMFDERQEAAISGQTAFRSGLYAPLGVLDAVDDGDLVAWYGNIQRSAVKSMRAQVDDNGGTLRNITQQLLNYRLAQSRQLSGANLSFMYGRFDPMRKFLDPLTKWATSGQSTDNPMRYPPPGAAGVDVGIPKFRVFGLGVEGEIKFMPSRNAPSHTLIGIDASTFMIVHDGPPKWIDEDGLQYLRVAGKHEFIGGLYWRGAGLCCVNSRKNWRIDDAAGSHMEQ